MIARIIQTGHDLIREGLDHHLLPLPILSKIGDTETPLP